MRIASLSIQTAPSSTGTAAPVETKSIQYQARILPVKTIQHDIAQGFFQLLCRQLPEAHTPFSKTAGSSTHLGEVVIDASEPVNHPLHKPKVAQYEASVRLLFRCEPALSF